MSWCGEKLSYGNVSQSGEDERFGCPGRKETDFAADALCVLGVARDVQDEMAGLGDESRGDEARAAAEQGLPVARRTRRGERRCAPNPWGEQGEVERLF